MGRVPALHGLASEVGNPASKFFGTRNFCGHGRWTCCKMLSNAEQHLNTGRWVHCCCVVYACAFLGPCTEQVLLCPQLYGSSSGLLTMRSSRTGSATYTKPRWESSCVQDRHQYGRLQRRVIHGISQVAEEHLTKVLQAKLPAPAATDSMHPATKILAMQCVYFR